ncbi:MAG TPA: hypothetical protein VGO47_05370 [Chlamydiales bacterium]|nr:hypothetical protein [Chlamydiales bacterium]
MMAAFSKSKKDAEMEKNLPPTPVVPRDRDSQIFEAAQLRRVFEQAPGGEVKGRKTTYMELKDYSKQPIQKLSRGK